MDDAPAVGVGQRLGDVVRDADRVLDRELALACQPAAECLPLDVRHRVVQQLLRFAGIVEGQNEGMVEPSGRADLAQEPFDADGRRELGMEHLEGDRAIEFPVMGEVDRRHPPATERALDRVTPFEGCLQVSKLVCHGIPPARGGHRA